jgi:O-antigen/teichoic acid export membrane protein
MSVQLSRPFILIQTSLGTALSPEISRLHAENKHRDLYAFVMKFMSVFLVLVTLVVLVSWLVTPIIVESFLEASYLKAIPVFLILMISNGLVMAFQPCLPVAIAQGEVGRRNLAVCVRFLYLGLACIPGLSAMGVALSILAGNLTVRLTNDLPLLRRMKLAARNG